MITRFLPTVLRLDIAANAGGALALLAAGPWIADRLGLAEAWPLAPIALLLGVNAVAMARELSSPSGPRPAALRSLAALDLVFAAAVAVLAVTLPDAVTWSRWALGGLADVTATVGIVKLLATRPATSTSTVPGGAGYGTR